MLVPYFGGSAEFTGEPTPLMECEATATLEAFSRSVFALTKGMMAYLERHRQGAPATRCNCPMCVEAPHVWPVVNNLWAMLEAQGELLDELRPVTPAAFLEMREMTAPACVPVAVAVEVGGQ